MPKIRIEHKTSNQYPYSAFKIILDQADSTIFIKELSGIGTSVIKADGNILNWIVANYNNQPIYFTDNHHTTPVHINDYINQQEIEVKSDTFSISYSAQKEIKLTCVVIHKERKNPIILSSSAIKQKFPPDIDEKIANLITEQQYISDQLKSISENQHQHELFIQRVNAFNDLNSIYEKVMSNLNQTIESRFAGYESNVEKFMSAIQPLIQSNQSDHKNNSESDEMIKEAGKLIQKIALEIGFQEDHRDRSSIREKLNILVQKIEESSELNDQNEGLLITINQLKKFIERLSQENPLELLAQSVENNDLITAIHQFKNLYSAQTQGPISDDLIQSHLIGFTKSIWLISSDWVSSSHPIAEALRDCLKQINITLFFPKREESYQPHNHRVISRRAAREGEPLGRIIHVHAPGFKQNDNVIDKAEVIISD